MFEIGRSHVIPDKPVTLSIGMILGISLPLGVLFIVIVILLIMFCCCPHLLCCYAGGGKQQNYQGSWNQAGKRVIIVIITEKIQLT